MTKFTTPRNATEPRPDRPDSPQQRYSYRRVLCARHKHHDGEGLRALGRGKAKGRAKEDRRRSAAIAQYKDL
jgi:hypothetical protein